jgi:hypothetical protein
MTSARECSSGRRLRVFLRARLTQVNAPCVSQTVRHGAFLITGIFGVRTYRVLAFGPEVRSVHDIHCANDAEAMLQAINIGPAQMQVWEQARLVASIRPVSDQPGKEGAAFSADISAA